MPPPTQRTLRAAVGGVKLTVVAAVAAIAVVPAFAQGSSSTTGPPGPAGSAAPDLTAEADAIARARAVDPARVERLMSRHRCSATGFGPDVVPGSALVERDRRIWRVSFDDGWAVYTGHAAGTLVAVCRAGI